MTVSQLESQYLNKLEKERLEIIYPVYNNYEFVESINSLLSNFESIDLDNPWYRLMLINDNLKKENEVKLESFVTFLKAKRIPVKYLKSPYNASKETALEFGIKNSLSENILFIENCIKFSDNLYSHIEKFFSMKNTKRLYGNESVFSKTPDLIIFNAKNHKDLQQIISVLRKGIKPESRKDIEVCIQTVISKKEKPKEKIGIIKESPKEGIVNIATFDTPYRELPVAIMMTVWGRYDLTKQTIESLRENTEYPFKLIVVDDHSTKKIVDLLKEFEEKKMIDKLILREHRSKGTAGRDALNDGLKYIRENWLSEIGYIANQDNDFKFNNPYWLRCCVDAIEKYSKNQKYKIGAVSILNENETVHKTLEIIDIDDFSLNIKDNIGGGQYLFKKELWNDITGGMYYTDTEWQLWEKLRVHGISLGHITKAMSVFTFNWVEHAGAGQRSWDKKRCPA